MSDGPEKSARDATAFRDPATAGGWLSPVRECLLQRIPALNHYRAGIELRLVSVVDHRWRAERGRCGLVLRVRPIAILGTARPEESPARRRAGLPLRPGGDSPPPKLALSSAGAAHCSRRRAGSISASRRARCAKSASR